MLRRVLVCFLMLVPASFATAELQDKEVSPDDRRRARIQELVRQEKGEVTAMEASARDDGSVFVGFASGSVVHCPATGACDEFAGTPNVAVQHIAVARDGASQVVWVAYRQGALYRCRDRDCEKIGG